MNIRLRRRLPLVALIGVVVGAVLLAVWASSPTEAQQQAPGSSQQLSQQNNEGARVHRHQETGEVRFIGASKNNPIDRPAALPENASPEAAARAHLAEHGQLFGIDNQASELRAESTDELDGGRASTHFQQVHEDVPVLGGELNTQVDEANTLLVATGEVLPEISLDTEPGVEAKEDQEAALAKIAKDRELEAGEVEATEPELWIYDPSLLGAPGPDVTRLVWRMDITPAEGIVDFRELVLVDPQSSSVVLNFNQMHTVRDRKTYTMNNSNDRNALPGTRVCDESNSTCSGDDADAVAAHRFAGDTYDFYSSYHGRDSIDNAGMSMISSVHFGSNYNNAFWNPEKKQVVYGDGWTVDDFVGHELTHGVTNFESNLFYYYQSGAINESLSDLWGEFVDLSNNADPDDATRWLIGEDIPNRDALRDMENPPAFGDPDRMLSPNYFNDANVVNPQTGEDRENYDQGGVHTNSGVNNMAIHLMTDGGTFNGRTVTGLGITKVAKIYYEAQTNLLTSASDYQDLHSNLQQACINLTYIAATTAADCAEVRDAVDATEMNLTPTVARNPEAPVCPTGQTPTNLLFDNLENTASRNWFTWGTGWSYDSSYATSGTEHLQGANRGVTSDHAIYKNTDVTLPTGKTYLRFSHAYGFEDNNRGTYYDGGVLEYSTNNGSTWNDAGSLPTDNGYNGAIFSYNGGNPLGGSQGFVGESNGYISTRVDLSSLAGQSVRFRFRIGEDKSVGDEGWFVDDVRVYGCGTPIIVFASNRTTGTGVNNPTGDFEIFSMSPSGGNLRQLTNNTTDDNDPVISPDGTRIAYTNMKTLYAMNVDGSNNRILSRNMFISEEDPTWSPDGTKIAFAAQRSGIEMGVQDIWTIDANPDSTTPMTQLTNTPVYELAPSWSPDGTKIAYVRADNRDGWRGSLSTMRADGTGQTVILPSTPGWLVSDPDWSPEDGWRIAMTVAGPDGYQIAAINADGSNFAIQSPINQDNLQPAWSPDGSKITFASQRDTYNLNDNHEIYTADITNLWAATRLTSDPAQDREPDWGVLPENSGGSPGAQPPLREPDTTITSGPSGSVSATTASFVFSSSAPGSTFECSLDGATFSACTSPKEYSGLSNGEHTFQVRAVSADGIADPTPGSRTWTVDTAAPKVISTTPPANATGVDPGVNVSATLSELIIPSSINGTTFKLMKAGTTTAIAAVVSYDPKTSKATLDPTNNLRLGTKYKAVVATGAKDLAGNALDQDSSLSGSQPKQWVFTVRR